MKLSNRIYIVLLLSVVLWCGGILAAPLLRHFGFTAAAGEFYSFYSRVCHQDEARSFQLEGGHFAVCIRCSAIYFSFLAALLLVPIVRKLEKLSVPRAIFLLLAVLPMVADVALNDSGIHASTTFSRIVTGMLTGGALPWWILPLSIEAWSQILSRKKIHPHNSGVYSYVRKTQ